MHAIPAAGPIMLRIYDDAVLRRRLALSRARAIMLFVAGTASGLWMAHSGGTSLVTEAIAADPARQPPAAAWCDDPAGHGLRLDCRLSLPPLPRTLPP